MDVEEDELSDDDRALILRMQDVFIAEFAGGDPVAGMLKLGPFEAVQDAQRDYLIELARLLRVLGNLCGDEDCAISWLISSTQYREMNGNDPYFCLEQGGFWAVAVMLEWLQIIDRYRPVEIMKHLFEHRQSE